MTYEEVVRISGNVGLLLFVGMFVVVVFYALWPRNKSKFDDAARAPLDED